MQRDSLEHWKLDHSFDQDVKRVGESRTIVVIALTATMMVVEVVAGRVFGSMALLADGLHMASHAAALSINVGAYVYARRHAHDRRFSFGTGKVNSLGGFTGAVLLGVFAVVMVWESVARIFEPVAIAFNEAIAVAVIGLLVNGASVFILGHGHDRDSQLDDTSFDGLQSPTRERHTDHNLRSAYLHVLADALTSLLAIFALLTGKWFGAVWMDPAMGIVGAVLVGRWSLGLIWTTSAVLVDREAPSEIQDRITNSIEDGDARVVDLHVWAVAPGKYAAVVSLVADLPESPSFYKAKMLESLDLAHVTIEVNRHSDSETRHKC